MTKKPDASDNKNKKTAKKTVDKQRGDDVEKKELTKAQQAQIAQQKQAIAKHRQAVAERAKKFQDFVDAAPPSPPRKPPALAQVMLLTIMALVLTFLGWAMRFEIDERIRGSGQVITTQDIQRVQSLEGGILSELLVSEGDIVTEGQVVARLSAIETEAQEQTTGAQLYRLRIKLARLKAEANGDNFLADGAIDNTLLTEAPDIVANARNLYRSRQQELTNARKIIAQKKSRTNADISEARAEIARIQQSLEPLAEEIALTERLVAQKATPRIELLRLQRQRTDLRGQLSVAKKRLPGLRAQLRILDEELGDLDDRFRSEVLGALNEVQTQIRGLENSQTAIDDRVFRSELRAPAAGIVNTITQQTIGGVIQPAQVLMEIVPADDDLKIVAQISPNDIAFVKQDQPVKVTISAYDPVRFGRLEGKITRISATSVQGPQGTPFFEVDIRTEQATLGTDANPLPISPGMLATVDIITGKRSVMNYLLKPLLRARDNALREP